MNRPERDLSGFVVQPRSEADLTRYWRRLAPTVAAPAPRRRRWLISFAAAGLAGAVAFLLWVEGTRHEHQEAGPRTLELADGSRVTLGPDAVVSMAGNGANELRVVLERGSADFDVTHVPGRRFVVVAADVEVVVVGTRFVVTVSEGHEGRVAALSVQKGAVEVRQSNKRSLRFAPGETWSSASASAPAPAIPPAPDDLPPRSSALLPRKAPSRDVVRPLADTDSLFGAATQARLRGKHRDAANAFETFFQRFPDDARAPLAAFQLGRIQLDTFHDAARAAASFRAAVRLTRDPTLREVAAARQVEALDQGSDVSACRTARDAYRAAYPTGPHLGRVTAYCRNRQ